LYKAQVLVKKNGMELVNVLKQPSNEYGVPSYNHEYNTKYNTNYNTTYNIHSKAQLSGPRVVMRGGKHVDAEPVGGPARRRNPSPITTQGGGEA